MCFVVLMLCDVASHPAASLILAIAHSLVGRVQSGYTYKRAREAKRNCCRCAVLLLAVGSAVSLLWRGKQRYDTRTYYCCRVVAALLLWWCGGGGEVSRRGPTTTRRGGENLAEHALKNRAYETCLLFLNWFQVRSCEISDPNGNRPAFECELYKTVGESYRPSKSIPLHVYVRNQVVSR